MPGDTISRIRGMMMKNLLVLAISAASALGAIWLLFAVPAVHGLA
jgi:hypothetical protein